MLLILATSKPDEEEDADERLLDSGVPLRTNYPDRTRKAAGDGEGGTYPTELSMDKLMFQASSALPFKPSAQEVLEVAKGLRDKVVQKQLEALVEGEEVVAKTRWLIIPPKGLDVPKQMLVKKLNQIVVLTEDDSVVHRGNTHEFDNAQEAQHWLDHTLEALKKAHYKVL